MGFRGSLKRPCPCFFSDYTAGQDQRPQRLVQVEDFFRMTGDPDFLLYGILHHRGERFLHHHQVVELEEGFQQANRRMFAGTGPKPGPEISFFLFHLFCFFRLACYPALQERSCGSIHHNTSSLIAGPEARSNRRYLPIVSFSDTLYGKAGLEVCRNADGMEIKRHGTLHYP